MIVGTILALGVLHEARDVLIPISCAALFTFILAPTTRRIQRLGIGRMPAAAVVVLMVLCLGLGVGWLLGQQLYDLTSNVQVYQRNIHEKLAHINASATSLISRLGRSVQELPEAATVPAAGAPPVVRPVPVELVEPPPGLRDVLRSMAGPLLGPLTDVGIVMVFLFFMLVQREDVRDRLLRLIGEGRLSVTTQALDDAAQRMSRYLVALTLVNTAFGVLVGAGLFVLGVPNAALWGLIAGVLRFVPFLGTWIGLSMPLAVAVASTPGWTVPAETAGLFFVLELVTNSVAEPFIYGSGTGISTLAMVVSVAFWTWMWGAAGLILATPLTVCIVVISRYVPQLEFLGVLLGDERALPPDAQFYQRLLAGDQVEAAEVVDAQLAEHPPVAVYDAVMVPALAQAEVDRQHEVLSADRHRFVLQAVHDLIDDLAERQPDAESFRPGRIVCLPARDDADAAAARMLAQLIEGQGGSAVALTPELVSGEMLDVIEREHTDAIAISAIPPYGAMYATYMCKRVRKRFPNMPMVVGLWNSPLDSTAYKRVASACGGHVATSLAQALGQLLSLLPSWQPEADLPAPSVDPERVKEVEALGLLDTPPEAAYDHIVEDVARALAVPVAVLALVDGQREWWKAQVGAPADLAQARGGPLAGSLAARVVAAGHPVIVPDARRDPQVAASRLASATSARFFAGFPLPSPSGRVLGALYVLDTRPRHLTASERQLLELVAASALRKK